MVNYGKNIYNRRVLGKGSNFPNPSVPITTFRAHYGEEFLYMKKSIKFSDPDVFLSLEEQAADGTLDYTAFPPEEYKYFSKLSQLGYKNRHKGWAAEICERKRVEIKEQYAAERERADKAFRESQRLMYERIRCGQAITAIYKADDIYGVLDCALTAIEALTGEAGFKARIDKKIFEMYK